MSVKRKNYLFCTVENEGEYFYNIFTDEIHFYAKTELMKVKLNKTLWTYPIVVLILAFVRSNSNFVKTIPFFTLIVTAIITSLFFYLWFYPEQNKMIMKLPIVSLPPEKLKLLAFMGNQQLNKAPWVLIILLFIFLYYYLVHLYITGGNSTLAFIGEILTGFLTPLFIITPGLWSRKKIYRKILKGER